MFTEEDITIKLREFNHQYIMSLWLVMDDYDSSIDNYKLANV